MSILLFRGSGLVNSGTAVWGGGRTSLFPVPAELGQGLPHPQLRKWHRPPTSHLEETPGRPTGEVGKQRASEPHFFMHLSLARVSMKIWCFRKKDIAMRWRENANSNKTGYLPYISNPACAGFNCSLWMSLPRWPVSLITFFGKLLVIARGNLVWATWHLGGN